MNEGLNVVDTLIQKSPILSMEWDCKTTNILYLGSEAALVRVYDAQEKKFTQMLEVNKAYPRITQICSFMANGESIYLLPFEFRLLQLKLYNLQRSY